MYDALGSGTGVATEMANAINETEPERFERLTQRIQNVKAVSYTHLDVYKRQVLEGHRGL